MHCRGCCPGDMNRHSQDSVECLGTSGQTSQWRCETAGLSVELTAWVCIMSLIKPPWDPNLRGLSCWITPSVKPAMAFASGLPKIRLTIQDCRCLGAPGHPVPKMSCVAGTAWLCLLSSEAVQTSLCKRYYDGRQTKLTAKQFSLPLPMTAAE